MAVEISSADRPQSLLKYKLLGGTGNKVVVVLSEHSEQINISNYFPGANSEVQRFQDPVED